MMEPLERQAILQAMTQQQPPQPAQSPLTSGAVAAMDNIKRAMALDSDQRRQSLGAAIQNFSAGMANPANHRGGTLGAAAVSMSPALSAYQQANQAGQSENMQAFEIMQALEKQAEEKRRHAEDEKHRGSELAETKRYHDLMYGSTDIGKYENAINKGLINKDSIPIASMPANMQNKAFTLQNEDLKRGEEAKNMLNNLKEIKKLSDKYPNMHEDMTRLLYAKSLTPGASVKEIFGNTFMDKDKAAALDMMDKLTSRLVLSEIKSANGRTASDAYKQIVAKGKPHFGLHKKGLDFFIENMEKEIKPSYEHAKEQRKAMTYGGFLPLPIHELEDIESEISPTDAQKGIAPSEDAVQKLVAKGYSTEEIQELYDNGDLK